MLARSRRGAHRPSLRSTAVWPDGSAASVTATSVGLELEISPSSARGSHLRGLLGSADGDRSNDVAARDGTPLHAPISNQALFPDFADSWRVGTASSLFTYAPGQTTESFTDRSFPHAPVDVEADPGVEAARAACAKAGITDQPYLDDCLEDVEATGTVGAADAAAGAQAAARQRTRTVTVPDLTGQPQAAVEQTLHQDGLRTTVQQVPGSVSAAGALLCTRPGAGASVPLQTTVTLYVLGPGATSTPPC